MTNPVTQTLLGAAEFLSQPGAWQQGYHLRHKGMQPENLVPDDERDDDYQASEHMKDPTIVCACLEGAIYRAAPNDEVAEHAIGALTWVIGQIDPEAACVPEWNDKPGRTADEVVALLRETAKNRGA